MIRKIFFISLFHGVSAFSADTIALDSLFQSKFYTAYEERYCGRNTVGFVNSAVHANVNMDQTYIIGAEDSNGIFGLISGYRARGGGSVIRPEPAQPPYYEVGQKNWYFHAFLIAQDTVNPGRIGKVFVYDMSFENHPTVLEYSEYMMRMYLPPKAEHTLQNRQKKLKGMKYEIFDAVAHATRRSGGPDGKIAKAAYLTAWYPSFFENQNADDSDFIEGIEASR